MPKPAEVRARIIRRMGKRRAAALGFRGVPWSMYQT